MSFSVNYTNVNSNITPAYNNYSNAPQSTVSNYTLPANFVQSLAALYLMNDNARNMVDNMISGVFGKAYGYLKDLWGDIASNSNSNIRIVRASNLSPSGQVMRAEAIQREAARKTAVNQAREKVREDIVKKLRSIPNLSANDPIAELINMGFRDVYVRTLVNNPPLNFINQHRGDYMVTVHQNYEVNGELQRDMVKVNMIINKRKT